MSNLHFGHIKVPESINLSDPAEVFVFLSGTKGTLTYSFYKNVAAGKDTKAVLQHKNRLKRRVGDLIADNLSSEHLLAMVIREMSIRIEQLKEKLRSKDIIAATMIYTYGIVLEVADFIFEKKFGKSPDQIIKELGPFLGEFDREMDEKVGPRITNY